MLPLASLRGLDERLVHPVRPALERPQQRSFPNIHGLYLLLRATGLGVVDGMGAKGRLRVDQALQLQWQQLNATERYFNLLEAWLFFASTTMWGERGSYLGSHLLLNVVLLFERVPMLEQCFRGKSGRIDLSNDEQAHLALMRAFGFVDLELATPRPGENWSVVAVRTTDFGSALFRCIRELVMPSMLRFSQQDATGFGVCQATLGRYFPQWKQNLTFPEAEFRDGVHRFKVSLGRTWRRIEMPADCVLADLAGAILDAYRFDYDHLYCFTLRKRNGTKLNVESPGCDCEVFADELAIGMAPMRVGETFPFLYDFGDNWQFKIELEDILHTNPRLKKPRIIESHGEAPNQYGWDESEG